MTTKSERTTALVPKAACIARKSNGKPCANRPMKGQNVCKNHGGAAPAARRKAAERILMAQDLAAAKLIELMNNPDVPYGVQRMAAADLLDRGGNVAAHVLAIPGIGGEAAPAFMNLLTELASGSRAESRAARNVPDEEAPEWVAEELEVLDAEVVEDDEPAPRPTPRPTEPPASPAPASTGLMRMEDALDQLRATSPPPAPQAQRRNKHRR